MFTLSPAASAKPEPAPDSAWIAPANNAFAVELYQRLAAGEAGNLFVSPHSIAAALAMTSAGATGNTAAELARALHLPASLETAHSDLGNFIQNLNARKSAGGEPRAFQFSTANALWSREGTEFQPKFRRQVESAYGAATRELDFAGAPEGAREAINEWVAKQTRKKIRELIPQGGIEPQTRLILTNAVYFQSAWDTPFEKADTQAAAFKAGGTRSVSVPTMHQVGYFATARGSGCDLVKIPYQRRELSLVILLPRSANGLPALERALTPDKLAQWLKALNTPGREQAHLELALPRFRLTQHAELSAPLQALGIRDAFRPDAGFAAMTRATPTFLSSVVHQTFLRVDEEGTEAAGATALMTLGAGPDAPRPFRADHPFLFLIQHEATGAILFMGRLADPSASES